MVVGKMASLWIVRLTSAAVFLAVCYELLQWLPADDNAFEGIAVAIVLLLWFGANGFGFTLGFLVSKRVTIDAQIMPSVLWSSVVCAAYLVSKFSGPEIHDVTVVNYLIVATFLSVPLVGGWAWAQTGMRRNDVASNLGVAK